MLISEKFPELPVTVTVSSCAAPDAPGANTNPINASPSTNL
jgi:hypothetical protein